MAVTPMARAYVPLWATEVDAEIDVTAIWLLPTIPKPSVMPSSNVQLAIWQ